MIDAATMHDEYEVPGNFSVKVENGASVNAGDLLAGRGEQEIKASHGGKVNFKERSIVVTYEI